MKNSAVQNVTLGDTMVLRIRKKDLDNIILHARNCYPSEACGILAGKIVGGNKNVEEVYHTRNVLNSPSAYEIDSVEQLEIFEKTESCGLEILGFYHSHPFWDSFWSEIDEERSKLWIGYSYLIVSLKTGGINSYARRKDRTEKEEVIILQ
jgi:proteasome lid subunit RPN8/RPN11